VKKKVLLIPVALLLAISLVAIGCPAPEEPPPPPPPPTDGEPPPPEVEVTYWSGQADFAKTLAPFGPFKLGYVGTYGEAQFMVDWITKATNGRLVIDFADVGAINPPGETFDMVSKGVYPIGESSGPFYPGKMPETDIEVGLLFAHRDICDQWDCLFNYGLFEELRQAYAEHNIYWVPTFSGSTVSIGATFPLDTPESVEGKKIRALGQFGDYIATLGGSPAPVPLEEVYMGLKLGTIDGFVSGVNYMHSQKWDEVTKHFLLSPTCSLWSSNILINMDAFKALPEDIQELLDTNLPYVSFACATVWRQQDQWVITHAEKDFGIKFYTWSTEDTDRVTKMVIEQVWPKIAEKSPRNARMIEILKQQLRDYGRLD